MSQPPVKTRSFYRPRPFAGIVEKRNHSPRLFDLAVEDRVMLARTTADDSLLEHLALEDSSAEVRMAALETEHLSLAVMEQMITDEDETIAEVVCIYLAENDLQRFTEAEEFITT